MSSTVPANVSKEELRNLESRTSKVHDGKVPKDSEVSGLKSLMSDNATNQDPNQAVQELPVPDDLIPPHAPPGPGSGSLDQRITGSGRGGEVEGDQNAQKEPYAVESGVRVDGDVVGKETVDQPMDRKTENMY